MTTSVCGVIAERVKYVTSAVSTYKSEVDLYNDLLVSIVFSVFLYRFLFI